MRKLLTKLFALKEADVVVSTLHTLEGTFEGEENLCWPYVSARVQKMICHNEKAINETVRKGLQTPRELCFILIAEVTSDDLVSGRDHIYRGTLSGNGHRKRAMMHRALDQLVEMQRMTPDERADGIAHVDREIAEVG